MICFAPEKGATVRTRIFKTIRGATRFAKGKGFPIKVFAWFSLNWSGIAENPGQLQNLLKEAIEKSPIRTVGLKRL
jgi:hypothetical protein